MASITTKNGKRGALRMVQFVGLDGKRKTFRLGKMTAPTLAT